MAKELAKHGSSSHTGHGEGGQFLTFSVQGEAMGVDILDVDEIIEMGDMTRVPMANGSVRGVINLRGNVVPVIDLAHRLLGVHTQANRRSCIVLINHQIAGEHIVMGLLVDQVREILEIPDDAILKTPEFGTDIRQEFIGNMGRVDGVFIILLNMDRLLSVEDLSSAPGMEKKSDLMLPAASPSH